MIYNHRDVYRIIAKTLNCKEEELNACSGLTRTLNWDSLNHVIILSSIETHFGIQIPDEMFVILTSIGKIIDFLDTYHKKI